MATQRHGHTGHRSSISFRHQLRLPQDNDARAVLSCAGYFYIGDSNLLCQSRYRVDVQFFTSHDSSKPLCTISVKKCRMKSDPLTDLIPNVPHRLLGIWMPPEIV